VLLPKSFSPVPRQKKDKRTGEWEAQLRRPGGGFRDGEPPAGGSQALEHEELETGSAGDSTKIRTTRERNNKYVEKNLHIIS
jgi:hypothetical protein